MARGYPGAFGRHVNALYVWLPLCAPLLLRLLLPGAAVCRCSHLDLLVLLSFSVSLAFFNHARIDLSVPLVYPLLAYLLVRMLAVAPPGQGRRRRPLACSCPTRGSRSASSSSSASASALNVTDSNVIDVGYAGVIGADRIAARRAALRSYPDDNEHGDTYGPVNYFAYVPFRQIFGWSGTGTTSPPPTPSRSSFDLLAVAGLFLLGRRVRGPTLGIALAYAWAAYPFTLYALESNSNDFARRRPHPGPPCSSRSSPPRARGPRARSPDSPSSPRSRSRRCSATHGVRQLPSALARARALALFAVAFLFTAALVAVPALTHDSLHTSRSPHPRLPGPPRFPLLHLGPPRGARRRRDRRRGRRRRARPAARRPAPPRRPRRARRRVSRRPHRHPARRRTLVLPLSPLVFGLVVLALFGRLSDPRTPASATPSRKPSRAAPTPPRSRAPEPCTGPSPTPPLRPSVVGLEIRVHLAHQ